MTIKLFKLILSVCLILGFSAATAFADWFPGDGHKMHFPQLPDEFGWDVNATWNPEMPPPVVVADDWMCSETGWVKDIHFWGSWKHGMTGDVLGFILSIHSDYPGPPYSRPDSLLWESYIEDYMVLPFMGGMEGWYNPATGDVFPDDHMEYFQYNVFLPDSLWFFQEQGTIYWLNVTAIIADPMMTQWGWKTSLEHWNDAAVWSMDMMTWDPLYDPFTMEPLDMAFVITGGPDEEEGACCYGDPQLCTVTTENDCINNLLGIYQGDGTVCLGDNNGNGIDDQCDTWIPGDEHKMHFPQLPDEAGWDVNATQPLVLADDWMCSETGWVKDIHFWGSWMHGREGEILTFILSIHEDIPANPPEIPYSRPGLTLWERTISRFGSNPIDPPTMEGWYDPYSQEFIMDDHMEYFQYDIYLDSLDWFWQHNGTIYWLNISAIVAEPDSTQWGWKSSIDHWNDDAVWSLWGTLDWIDLWEPPDFIQSLDLAFVITGEGPELWDCDQNPPDDKTGGGWEIEPNNICSDASFAQCEYAYCGDIGLLEVDPEDWWVITLPTDTCYCLHVRVLANDTPGQFAYGGGLDPDLTIYAADCVTPLFYNNDHWGTFPDAEGHDSQYDCHDLGNCHLPGTTLYIRISNADNQTSGPYLLIINCYPCECPEEVDTCSYYKSPYPDYAPAGMPDFDQKQDAWQSPFNGNWSWCGPVALANCFWWFDSKFETNTTPPPAIIDNYPLVQAYGFWDDHDQVNTMPFIQALMPYCNTDGAAPGTMFWDLVAGAQLWIDSAGLTDSFTVTPFVGPDMEIITSNILISQDVILLLGFYELTDEEPFCKWVGGHYVTCAGACPEEPAICISDPYFDLNEGNPPGLPPHASNVHNDAQFVSGPHGTMHHDKYYMAWYTGPPCPTPGTVTLSNYTTDWFNWLWNFESQNPLDPIGVPVQYTGGPIAVIIDAALIICPVEERVPDINVKPDTLDYNQCIETAQTYTDQIIICNSGTGVLVVDSITCDLPFFNVMLITEPFSVNPAACETLDVMIDTHGYPAGPYAGNCHVYSNDPDEPVVDRPHIRVEITEPDIAVVPDSIYHAQVVNTVVSYPSDFHIRNNGGCRLHYMISYTPPWATLTGATGMIPPFSGDPIDVDINTNGLLPGIYIDSVTINSDDPDTPILYCPIIVIEVTPIPPDSLFWKDYNGDDPEGYMPDFDQNQDINGNGMPDDWAYCGPTSVANSLWWFQGKFPTRGIVPDVYYGADPPDPVGFINELAGYMKTNVGMLGTHVDSMQAGIDEYLLDNGLDDLLYEHTIYMPTYDTICTEIEICQDVTLLIGFWMVTAVYEEPPYFFVDWARIGGHYVTAHGFNEEGLLIGISDPDADNAGQGVSAGIIRGTNHAHGGVPFHDPLYDHSQHNDGVSASHDVYDVIVLDPDGMCSPAGLWELDHWYWRDMVTAGRYDDQNGGSVIIPFELWTCPYVELPPEVGMIFAEIEAAVIISPVAQFNFEYLPGDANMFFGLWPPTVIGGDVTYLVNYFKGVTTSQPCLMNNPSAPTPPGPFFWASADANGDCRVMGSDVIRLVAYFRGQQPIEWCFEYPPGYPPIPIPAPPGWPNCQSPPVIPSGEEVIIPSQLEK